MRIIKSARLDAQAANASLELEQINRLAKTELGEDEVYIFSVLLCDNEIDRDFERFTESAIYELRELFVGKTGIADHDWSAGKQKARIFRTEVVTEPEAENSLGEPYTFLRGWAYMLRTGSTDELIAEIEGGIKREVSIGCSMGASRCSVCGEEIGSAKCSHIRGREYGGTLCFAELSDAVDAYEWSFVAVPAQKNAGVLKAFECGGDGDAKDLKAFECGGDGDAKDLKAFEGDDRTVFADARLCKLAALGERYMAELRHEVKRLGLLADPQLGEALCRALDNMGEDELLAFKKSFEAQVQRKFPPVTQLPGIGKVTRFEDGAEYQI